MSQITFGGLASGLDTDSIIEALMEIEEQPLTSLENDQAYLESETEAYSELDSKLSALLDAVEAIDTLKEISSYATSSSDEGTLTASADSSASLGVYSIEIVSLAKTQKDVSDDGFADTSSETLSGSLTIGDTTIDYSDVSLSELVDLVNDADAGVSASIVNDGTENGYRLVFTGDEAGVTTEISGTGSVSIDTATDGHMRDAEQAHVIVDNLDIYSNSNTLTDVIPGVDLDLLDTTETGETLTLKVETDTDTVKQKVDDFVSAYNDIIDWVSDQSDADWGNDSSIRTVKNKLQRFMSEQLDTGGSFTSLAQLGFETNSKTGKISYNSSTLTEAIEDDLASISALFAGTDDTDGIADKFASYLDMQTDSYDGLYARRKASNDSSISRIENNISALELRLEKRETFLREQYTALELLMSELNSQQSYLSAISSD